MTFRYEWDLIKCKMWNWMLKFLSKCPYSWFDILGLFFPASCPNETHFFNWESLHARLNSHCKACGYKKSHRKHTENLFRKNRCLLIRHLKPYPETRTTEPSLFAFKGGLIVYNMVFCFSGCWFSGLELRISELFKCPKYWKRDVTLP